ncbi:MAG: N-acetylglucosamine kinase [Gaiellales bacterium]
MSGRFVLGCDGGNTKTIALVATDDGTIVGWGRGGSSDVHDNPAALDELRAAVADACAMAGCQTDDVAQASFGLAGADWPEDFALLDEAMRAQLRAGVTILNDAVNAIRCGTPDGVGIVVSCGTGGTAAGMGPDGTIYHRGFWPEPSGAREIGRLGLSAVQRAHLGIGLPTALTERALTRYGASDPDALLHALTCRDRGASTDSRWFCPDVLDVAAEGDPIAMAIVRREGKTLGEQAAVCVRELGFAGAFPLVLVGGVFRHPSSLLREAVQAEVPQGVPVEAAVEPAVGALLRAFDTLGIEGDAAVRASLPDAAVFATG